MTLRISARWVVFAFLLATMVFGADAAAYSIMNDITVDGGSWGCDKAA